MFVQNRLTGQLLGLLSSFLHVMRVAFSTVFYTCDVRKQTITASKYISLSINNMRTWHRVKTFMIYEFICHNFPPYEGFDYNKWLFAARTYALRLFISIRYISKDFHQACLLYIYIFSLWSLLTYELFCLLVVMFLEVSCARTKISNSLRS